MASLQQRLNTAIQHHTAGQLSETERLCQNILETHSNHPVALHLLGVTYHQLGKTEAAVDLIEKATIAKPDYAEAHSSLGNALYALNRHADAADSFRRAIKINPDFLEAQFNLGKLSIALDKPLDAIVCFQTAVRLKPDLSDAHFNLATTLQRLGQFEDAALSYLEVLHLKPLFLEARFRLGVVFQELGRLEESAACYRLVIEQSPDIAEAHNNLGNVLKDTRRSLEALDCYKAALSVNPEYAAAHFNLGNLHLEMDRLEEAMPCFERALAIQPDYTNALRSKGITHLKMAQTQPALNNLQRALAVAPDDTLTKHNLALALLTDGQYSAGWEFYEHRWRSDPEKFGWREFPQPLWDGFDLTGKSLLVWAEQGFGDEIVFASLYRELLKRGAQCYFEIDPRLVDLFQRSFPEAIVIARSNPPHPHLLEDTIDYQCPAGSLARWLLESLDQSVDRETYLMAANDRVAELSRKYRTSNAPKVVGLGWQTIHAKVKSQYNFPLELFDPLLSEPGVQFVNLQYGDHSSEIEATYQRTGVRILEDKTVDPLKDMDLFAAQVASMDLVISIVNSTAVIGSALGVSTWGLVPHASEWRWGNEADHCLWYPSMALFRQSNSGQWADVSDQLAKAFKEWLAAA